MTSNRDYWERVRTPVGPAPGTSKEANPTSRTASGGPFPRLLECGWVDIHLSHVRPSSLPRRGGLGGMSIVVQTAYFLFPRSAGLVGDLRVPIVGDRVLRSVQPCSSSSASAQPTATPTIIPILASSASSVRSARSRSSGSSSASALASAGLVRLGEPAAGLERLGEDPLQLRRRAGDQRLGLLEAPGRRQRLDRRLELRVGVAHSCAALVHARAVKSSR